MAHFYVNIKYKCLTSGEWGMVPFYILFHTTRQAIQIGNGKPKFVTILLIKQLFGIDISQIDKIGLLKTN